MSEYYMMLMSHQNFPKVNTNKSVAFHSYNYTLFLMATHFEWSFMDVKVIKPVQHILYIVKKKEGKKA